MTAGTELDTSLSSQTTRSDEVRLEKLSWRQIQEAIDTGKHTVILVAASIEQHGPHLPCDADAIYGCEMAVRAAQHLGTALVAPVIRPGCSEHHMGFPGTISISPEVLVATVKDYIRCLASAGFTSIIVTSSHGGNFGPLVNALPEFEKFASELGIRLIPVLDLARWIAALRAVPDRHGKVQAVPAFAGDLIETSILLSLCPENVVMEHAEVGFLGDFDVEDSFRTGLKQLTANGILGDPREATADLGEEIVQELVEYLLQGIEMESAR